uniref:Disease resistance protein At4g27190-like leucine-rich repeats domain-containing protein n=1 Tax=Quercus lobata TaxID=97700 RepID=A0A7N2MQ37_QUELO
MWKNVPQGIQGFQNLTSIEVYSCRHLIYLIPLSIAKLLVKLQSIDLSVCDAIKNIVQRDGEEEAANIIIFPKLSSLDLQWLPNLVSFCIEAYSFGWPSIKDITLRHCCNLKTIGSETQSPRKLKKINEELDSRPHEPRIRSLGFLGRCLECVPRSKNYGPMAVSDQGTTNKSQKSYSVKKECFCKEKNAFEWPSLKKIMVIGCPNLRTFVPTNLKTPKLEGVYEDKIFKTPQRKGDLNTTLEHIFKGKEKQVDHDIQKQEQTEKQVDHETQQQEKLRPMRQNSETDM